MYGKADVYHTLTILTTTRPGNWPVVAHDQSGGMYYFELDGKPGNSGIPWAENIPESPKEEWINIYWGLFSKSIIPSSYFPSPEEAQQNIRLDLKTPDGDPYYIYLGTVSITDRHKL